MWPFPLELGQQNEISFVQAFQCFFSVHFLFGSLFLTCFFVSLLKSAHKAAGFPPPFLCGALPAG